MNEQAPDVVSLQELNEYTHQKLVDDAKEYHYIMSNFTTVDLLDNFSKKLFPKSDSISNSASKVIFII